MAKYELKFLSYRNEFSKFKESEFIKVECDDCLGDEDQVVGKEISISGYSGWSEQEFMVSLDISTAIKFAKTLRTEINKAKLEVDNG